MKKGGLLIWVIFVFMGACGIYVFIGTHFNYRGLLCVPEAWMPIYYISIILMGISGIYIFLALVGGGSIRQEKKEETCQQSQIELNQQVDTIETNDSYLKILKMRYAKGEISKEEYEQMKKDIED